MKTIGPIDRNSLFFFVSISVLADLMVLFVMRRSQPVPDPTSPPQTRTVAWTARHDRLWMASVYIRSFLYIMLLTAEFIYAKSVSAPLPATVVQFSNGQTIIPLKQIYDSDIHAFQAK